VTIRTYGGKPLIVGGSFATADGCCCGDGPEQGPCENCLDDCFCVHLHGYNFCNGDYYEVTDCGTPAANCVQDIWQRNPSTGQFFYTRNEYGPLQGSGATGNVDGWGVSFSGGLGECSNGAWGFPQIDSFAQEFRPEDLTNPVRVTALQYTSYSVTRDSDGCPVNVNPGSAIDAPAGFPPAEDIEPLSPDITFTPCPPGGVEFFSLAAKPGTELKALLASFGITASPTCPCNEMAAQMDAWGADESLKNIEQIVDVMQKTAAGRRLPFLRAVGRKLVRIACARARRKSAQTGH
jgi:hypothetical protein